MASTGVAQASSVPASRAGRVRAVAYWALTLVVAWEMVAGSLWDLLQIEYVRVIFAHLGYPLYVLSVVGAWKLPCALTLLVPRFPRLKEWAYAGAFFNYSGAAASHALVGDDTVVWLGPLGFAAFTLASWALRPTDRRLTQQSPIPGNSSVSWIVPVGLVAAFVALAIVTLPVGPPPPWAYGSSTTVRPAAG